MVHRRLIFEMVSTAQQNKERSDVSPRRLTACTPSPKGRSTHVITGDRHPSHLDASLHFSRRGRGCGAMSDNRPAWMVELARKKAAAKEAAGAKATPTVAPSQPTPSPAAIAKPAPDVIAPRAAPAMAAKAPSAQNVASPPPAAPTESPAKPAPLMRRRSSTLRQEMDVAMAPAWAAFMEAHEVGPTVAAYQTLRRSCKVTEGASGRAAFDAVKEATAVSTVPHKLKSLMTALAENWKLRPTADSGSRVVISGAGPVGLRAAVEAALMGMRVHVIEKRDVFSRVNILMLWQGTADDLVAYGARVFYPKFTNRHMGTSPLHLGTREIQLVLLKNALLLGVEFSYGTELIAVHAPTPGAATACWKAWALPAADKTTHQTAGGVLDFKPNKQADCAHYYRT